MRSVFYIPMYNKDSFSAAFSDGKRKETTLVIKSCLCPLVFVI